MQRIFIDNHDRILYYSNPAGYIAGKEAVAEHAKCNFVVSRQSLKILYKPA